MKELVRGANGPLDGSGAGGRVRMTLSWASSPGLDGHIDLVALLVTDTGRVRGDEDMVFYNAPATPDGAVRHLGHATGPSGTATDTLTATLYALPAEITRVALAATLDTADLTFAEVRDLALHVTSGAEGGGYRLNLTGAGTETAYLAGELYRRDGTWRVRAVGQGWDDGLAGLARDFGISVATDTPTPPPADPTGGPTPPPSPGPASSDTSASVVPDYAALIRRFRSILASRGRPDPTAEHRLRAGAAAHAAERAHLYAVDPDGRRAYKQARLDEAAALTAVLDAEVEVLTGVLHPSLATITAVSAGELAPAVPAPTFSPGALAQPTPPPTLEGFLPAPLTGARKFLTGEQRKHAAAVEDGRRRWTDAQAQHAAAERAREQRLRDAQAEHDARLATHQRQQDQQRAEAGRLLAGLAAHDPAAVAAYAELVLLNAASAGVFPRSFPHRFQIAYTRDSHQLVVEYELPGADIIPAAKAHKYVQTSDTITPVARTLSDRKALYAQLVAQICLAVLRTLFSADPADAFQTVVLNAVVDTIDPATGAPARPCLATLRTTRDTFHTLNLSNVDPGACLKHLGASVSKNPSELTPVRPVLEFSMVDPRFIASTDVLGGLDTRPNLMDLSPGEFESLITNLFSRMGLETRQTQASRDGGVDCVAFDPRPIFGGKVVIQAKRYKNTVGVSAVRDLYGTLQNEGASKGILVSTSGYGQSSYQFATGKPLELIDGANLLYLLAEHAGVDARIVPPDDWRDPRPDNPTTPS